MRVTEPRQSCRVRSCFGVDGAPSFLEIARSPWAVDRRYFLAESLGRNRRVYGHAAFMEAVPRSQGPVPAMAFSSVVKGSR